MLRLRHALHLRPVDRAWSEQCFHYALKEARDRASIDGRFSARGKTNARVSATATFSTTENTNPRAVVEGTVRALLTPSDIAAGRLELRAGPRPPSGRLSAVYQVVTGPIRVGSLSAVRVYAWCDTEAWWERGQVEPITLTVATRPFTMEMRIGPPVAGSQRWEVPVETTISGMWWMAAVVLVALNHPGRRMRTLYQRYQPDQGPNDPANVSGGVLNDPVLPGQSLIEARLRRALITMASEWNRTAPALMCRDPAQLISEKAESWSGSIRWA